MSIHLYFHQMLPQFRYLSFDRTVNDHVPDYGLYASYQVRVYVGLDLKFFPDFSSSLSFMMFNNSGRGAWRSL
jgi:hypothetical protein